MIYYLLMAYSLVLLAGLFWFGIGKPIAILKPITIKLFVFIGISASVLALLEFMPYGPFLVYGLITVCACFELCRLKPGDKPLRTFMAPILLTAFFCMAFIKIPHAAVFICVVSFDAFSQFFGQLFGKRQLWKTISPNKTIEGAIGGLGMCVLTSAFVLGSFLWGFLIAATALGGDLLASYIKRKAGLKDFGNLLPGQGGVLDRFDSLIITLPVYTLVYYLIA